MSSSIKLSDLADRGWTVADGTKSYEAIQTALLIRIFWELQTLNRLLACPRFTKLPLTLNKIERNTAKRKPAKRKRAKADNQ